jgi:hypothetical protein
VGYNGVGFPLPTPGILTPETIPNCTQDLAGVQAAYISSSGPDEALVITTHIS